MMRQTVLDIAVDPPEVILFPVGKRIVAGMRYLDPLLGLEWRSRIDVNRLDVSSNSCCVIGQLFGDYKAGCCELNIEPLKEAAVFGFNVTDSGSPYAARELEALTNGWKVALRAATRTVRLKRMKIAA